MNNSLWLNQYCKDLTIVAGMPRSGKSLLAPLISSMDESEMFHMDFLVETFPALKDLNMLSPDGLVYLLQYSIHTLSYNRAIGRNMNIRVSDETSVWQSKNPQNYFERLLTNDGAEFLHNCSDTYKFPLILVLHNALTYVDFLYKAFEKIKVINICSHPIDIVDAWMKKKYGQDIYAERGVALPVVKWKNSIIPIYAQNWEDEYLFLSEIDRVISMLYQLHLKENISLSKVIAQDKSKLLMVNYDELVMNSNEELIKISNYLKKSKTLFTDKTLQKMELKERKRSILDREKKLKTIKSQASNSCLKKLDAWISSFNQIKY